MKDVHYYHKRIDSHIPQFQQHEEEIIINLRIKYLDILIIPCFFYKSKSKKKV